MLPRLSILVATSILISSAIAQVQGAPNCTLSSHCPQELPCCSLYGQCGTGAYCLGGCDPRMSYNIDSCMPAPTCRDVSLAMNKASDDVSAFSYLGDVGNYSFTTQGQPVVQSDGTLFTMPESTGGTLFSSTFYVWYGRVSVKMVSSSGQGVVSAFILMSDVKDEIDFEFVGNDLQQVQSNFYWQGVLNYTNSANLTVASTDTNVHTYTIDWTPDTLTWYIDNTAMRVLNKKDTFNSSSNTYQYPQSPSRIMLSLWPAGSRQNGQGTITWAGGLVNWNDQNLMSNGYYHSKIYGVDVQCYNPPSDAAKSTGSNSYKYNNVAGLESNVLVSSDNYILGSQYDNGNNNSYNPAAAKTSTALPTLANIPSIGGSPPNIVPGSNNIGGGTGSSGPAGGGGGSTNTGQGFVQGLDSKSVAFKSIPSTFTAIFSVVLAIFVL